MQDSATTEAFLDEACKKLYTFNLFNKLIVFFCCRCYAKI
jgi:hypothetical protein